ncbi:MAG: tRNA (N(6)-L-threonylcarbamoyladenosine(37)-C(2))-methylthiotransferase MtaB [Gammaproteobacteria bacterium]|nr:tRNA (N(6)-L-threonylcarbamoyladenosine(37)-C(2))-methylthiotransferase MtaB [Gammaproteobacteria bacterium]
MRVFLQALGCRLNEAEIETWSRDCRARGYRLADAAERADLVVINTCAVTTESVRKSRQLIRRAQRANPHAKLVVSGCYASLPADRDGEQLGAELGVDLVVPNSDKDRLIGIAAERLDLPVMPELATEPGENALLARGRHRAFVKVQDGCRYRCAFCVVTQARGDERSRPVADVVDEVRRLHADGVNEVVLAGVHLGGYGSERASDLRSLITAVLADTDMPRVRLGSLEPWELPDGFWRLFDNPRLMPHLHLPIQSGADSVLRRMSRRCRSAEFRALVDAARATVADFNVTTDIIVGFPGESDAEWAETMAFADDLAFGHVHVFAYSPRSGTKAAAMPGQVDREVKRARSRQLHTLAAHSRRAVLSGFVDRTFDVLVEQRLDNGQWSGYTPNFLRVELTADSVDAAANRVVTVHTTAVSDDGGRLLAMPA